MNLNSIKIPNIQYRSGNTFRFRQRIIDRNGKTVDFTKRITVPYDLKNINDVKKYLEERRAELLVEKKSYYSQSERPFREIIGEYLTESGSALLSAINNKNEYETGKRALSLKTFETYKEYAPRVIAVLGDLKLKEITSVHIEKFMNMLCNPSVRNDTLFAANDKLIRLIRESRLSNNSLSKKIPINRHSLVNLRSGKGVSLKSATYISCFFNEPIDEIFVEQTKSTGLSPKSINNYAAFISAVFSWAIKAKYISDNPCKSIKKFKVKADTKSALPVEEIRKFLNALNGTDIEFKLQNYILFFCGCRRGEMLGLRFSSINFIEKTITFKQSVLYDKAVGNYISTLKNSKPRSLKICDALYNLLVEYTNQKKAQCASLGIPFDDNSYLFTNKSGGLLNPDTFSDRLRRFKAANSLKASSINCIKLRHNFATQLLENGESPYSVAKDMGHFSPSTTFSFYADSIEIGRRKNLSQSLEDSIKRILQ